MPWCEDCSRFWNPPSMPADGTCPSCGRQLGEVPYAKIPWHFWLLIAVAAVYLGWRLIQGIGWLFAR
jgi:hypothetical protein